jgi:hypothetical protein
MRNNESILDAAVESWPGLAALIIRNNAAEIHKKKAVDGNAFKLFRRFIAVAQDGSRSGQHASLISWCARCVHCIIGGN